MKTYGRKLIAGLLAAAMLCMIGCQGGGTASLPASDPASDVSSSGSVPTGSTPTGSTPESHEPDSSAPESSEPTTSVPSISRPPTVSLPSSRPESSTPSTSRPPTVSLPTSTPSTSTPSSSTPSTSQPESSTPTAPPLVCTVEDPTSYLDDPVARWRYTPTVVSSNPADRDFRLDAMNYQSIAWPKYNKNAPAKLVTYTEAQKQAQREAGDRLQEQVWQALQAGRKELTLAPGIYRFPAGDIPVNLYRVEDFTLIGYGVELILEGYQRAINLVECDDVVMVGFTVDRDPYRHTQFEVLAYDWNTDRLTVRVMKGYEPENAPASGDLQFFADDGTWQQHVFTHYTRFEWTDRANRIGVYYGVDPVESAVNEWLIGTLGSTILSGGTTVMYMTNCGDCHFVDIVNYGGGMMNSGVGVTGTCYYLRNKDMPRPGTNSLIAGGWGLVPYLGGGAVVEDCVYGWTNDDGMDTLAWNSALYKQESANTLLLVTMTDCPFKVGDTVRLYKRAQGTWYGEAKVTAVEVVWDANMMNDAKRVFSSEGRWLGLGNTSHLVRITLDKSFALETGDVVENYTSFRPEQVVIKGTIFRDVFCRVLLQGAKTTYLENNLFMRTGLPALLLTNEMYGFSEGKTTENVVIRGNTFVDSPWSQYTTYGSGIFTGTISIGLGDYDSNGSNLSKPFSNIWIEDNWIIQSMFSAIQVKNVDGLVIRNNRIDVPVTRKGLSPNNPVNPGWYYYREYQTTAIFVYACANVTVEGNIVNRGNGHCTRDVLLKNCE